MKPEHVAWLVRLGVFVVAAVVFLAATMFVVQFMMWLKSDRWLDWSIIYALVVHGGSAPTGSWSGFRNLSEWIVTAPVEVGSWFAAVILLIVFTVVRIFARR